MTKPAARTVANLAIGTASVAAAYVVLTTPPLRRLAGIAARRWLGVSLPGFLLATAARAWNDSGREAQERPVA